MSKEIVDCHYCEYAMCQDKDNLCDYYEKNVCACVVDLAKYNNISMGELFNE